MEVVPTDEPESVEAAEGVELTRLLSGEKMSVLHYRIEPGFRVPSHHHHHEQTGYVLEGEVTFELEDEAKRLTAGDAYVLASHEVHAAANTGDVPMTGIDIFSPPRTRAPYEDE